MHPRPAPVRLCRARLGSRHIAYGAVDRLGGEDLAHDQGCESTYGCVVSGITALNGEILGDPFDDVAQDSSSSVVDEPGDGVFLSRMVYTDVGLATVPAAEP